MKPGEWIVCVEAYGFPASARKYNYDADYPIGVELVSTWTTCFTVCCTGKHGKEN